MQEIMNCIMKLTNSGFISIEHDLLAVSHVTSLHCIAIYIYSVSKLTKYKVKAAELTIGIII